MSKIQIIASHYKKLIKKSESETIEMVTTAFYDVQRNKELSSISLYKVKEDQNTLHVVVNAHKVPVQYQKRLQEIIQHGIEFYLAERNRFDLKRKLQVSFIQ